MDVETSTKLIKPALSPAQRQAAILLAKGCTQAETARTIGRAKWTVGQWLRHNSIFQAEVERLIEESRRQVFERLPKLTELALNTLEEALKAPYVSDKRMESARYIVDRLLSLSARLPAHDSAEATEISAGPPVIDVEPLTIPEPPLAAKGGDGAVHQVAGVVGAGPQAAVGHAVVIDQPVAGALPIAPPLATQLAPLLTLTWAQFLDSLPSDKLFKVQDIDNNLPLHPHDDYTFAEIHDDFPGWTVRQFRIRQEVMGYDTPTVEEVLAWEELE